MGYTHYWNTVAPKREKGNAEKAEKQYQKAIRQCQRLIKRHNAELKAIDSKHPSRLSGYTAHCKVSQYGGLNVNGAGDLKHEDFCMREHFAENHDGDFCKTARKPYDVAVVACLIILKHYLGDLFQVESDGDANDWTDGLELAKKHLNMKHLNIPASIRRNLRLVDSAS